MTLKERMFDWPSLLYFRENIDTNQIIDLIFRIMNPKVLHCLTKYYFYQLLREVQGLVLLGLPLQGQLSLTALMYIYFLAQISKMFSFLFREVILATHNCLFILVV